jgi:hypothetical protein
MQPEDSRSRSNELADQLRLIEKLASGQWECLECPLCHNQTVTAWFTHPMEDEYSTWFGM